MWDWVNSPRCARVSPDRSLQPSRYEEIGWEVPRLLGLMPSTPDLYFDAAAQIRMAQWSQDRAALAGDAGYCAAPHVWSRHESRSHRCLCTSRRIAAASGANQTAFQKYEREMRPSVALKQELAVRSAELMRPKAKGFRRGCSSPSCGLHLVA